MSDNGSNRLDKTLELIFRPISKLLIKNEIPVRRAVEALKKSLVSAAVKSSDTTDSHVSLKTGLHRKDVRRLRAEDAVVPPKKMPISPIAALLTHWSEDADFAESPGRPRDLLRQGSARQPGFDSLVRASKIDLPAATVLTEMEAQHLIEHLPDGRLRLLSTTYLPKTDDAALASFDATVSDHIRIATENATSAPDAPKHFDRVLRYSHLSQASVERLEAEARQRAAAYLAELNALAHELQTRDDASGNQGRGRFVSGVFIAPTPAPQDPAQDDE